MHLVFAGVELHKASLDGVGAVGRVFAQFFAVHAQVKAVVTAHHKTVLATFKGFYLVIHIDKKVICVSGNIAQFGVAETLFNAQV